MLDRTAMVEIIRTTPAGVSAKDLARLMHTCQATIWRNLALALGEGAQIVRTHHFGPGVLWCATERRDALLAKIQAERRERELAKQKLYNERMRVKVRKERPSLPMRQETVPAALAPRLDVTAPTSVFGWRP